MKTDIKLACGHMQTFDIYGSAAERERRAAWIADHCICKECEAKERAEEEAEAEREAAAEGLPALVGTTRQVAWAMTIRKDILDKLEAVQTAQTEAKRKVIEHYKAETDAAKFIDKRKLDAPGLIRYAIAEGALG